MSRSHQVSFNRFVVSAKAEAEEFLPSFTVLNLAPFIGKLKLDLGMIEDSEIVQTLKSELCQNIESVNLSGHPEGIIAWDMNPMIKLLSDYLPKLKYTYIKDIDLSLIDNQIIEDQLLCKFYAKGIYIEGSDALMEIIKNKVIDFLRSNGQSTYGRQLERLGFMPQTLLPEKFQKALEFDAKLRKKFAKEEIDLAEKKSQEAMIAIRSRSNRKPIPNNNQTSTGKNEYLDRIKYKK